MTDEVGVPVETVTPSSSYRLVLPQWIREPLGLRPGQRFLVRASGSGIGLIPCEPLHALRGFLSGADTDLDDIREREERV